MRSTTKTKPEPTTGPKPDQIKDITYQGEVSDKWKELAAYTVMGKGDMRPSVLRSRKPIEKLREKYILVRPIRVGKNGETL